MSTSRRAKLARETKMKAEAAEQKRKKALQPTSSVKNEFKTLNVNKMYNKDNRTDQYGSYQGTAYNTSKAEKKEYTGSLVQGIATMHKSNAVPVINQEEAESISKMGRS